MSYGDYETQHGCSDAMLDSLSLQLREAEARRADAERAHQEALNHLRAVTNSGRSNEPIETLQSRARELEKKAALETVRCEELQLELSSAVKSRQGGSGSGIGGSSHRTSHPGSSHSGPTVTWAPSTSGTNAGSGEIERIMAKIEQDNRILAELEHPRGITTSTGSPLPSRSSMATGMPPQLGQSSTMPMLSMHNSYAPPSGSASYCLGLSGGLSGTTNPVSAYSYQHSHTTHTSHPSHSSNVTGLMGMGTSHGITSLGLSHGTGLSHGGHTGHSGLTGTMGGTSGVGGPPLPPYSAAYSAYSNTMMPLTSTAMSVKLKPLEEMELGVGRYGGGQRIQTPCSPMAPTWMDGATLYSGLDGVNPAFMHSQTRPMSRIVGLDLDCRGHTLNGGGLGEPQVDMLDIPGKGRCCVYIARFSYDPPDLEGSEGELALCAGDYLLVWGGGGEAAGGYLDGELLDGRRGLVPAHFVQRLVGDDLLEFHQAVVSTLRDVDDGPCEPAPLPPLPPMNSSGQGDMSRLCHVNEMHEQTQHDAEEGDNVPAPRHLTLERQLNKSVLIGWSSPDPPGGQQVESYHVYVDGVLKVTVKASERTRALVEGVDSNRPHRISVRSVTLNRRTSRDAACTMVIGRDTSHLGPSSVRATHVTCSQAVISWLPANSNHQHVVCVNNVEVRTVKPGVYRHTITGLAPSTQYRVTVRAKHLRAPGQAPPAGPPPEEAPGAYADFRTLAKGLPDPPQDILVEAGPQDGTLLVTWQPVTRPPASGPVTGYAVYADGKKVTDVDSPTGDHALIDIGKLLGLNPRAVTVRTKSRDAQSADSAPTPIPGVVRNNASRGGRLPHTGVPPHMRGAGGMRGPNQNHPQQQQQQQQQVIDHDENLSDKEVFPQGMQMQQHHQSQHGSGGIPQIEITKEQQQHDAQFSEDDFDRRRHHQGHQQQQQQQQQQLQQQQLQQQQGQQGQPPRNHQERGRPPPPPGQQGAPGAQYYPPTGQGQAGNTRGAGHQRGGPAPHKRPRWFVALFDYEPSTMSPNPDACDEELPFSEGDTIKVFGDKDADGFYWGECRNRRGFVPHNMVAEVEESTAVSGQAVVQGSSQRASRERWGDIYANMPVRRMVALYDYDPQELSPNVDAEVELSFSTGALILVYGDMDDDGFYMGEIDGVRGLVPSNFLTEADQYNTPQGQPGQGVQNRGGGRGGRGHGPGARGPPPPPRDNMGRQIGGQQGKDACPTPPVTLLEHTTTTTGPDLQQQARQRGGNMNVRGRDGSGFPMGAMGSNPQNPQLSQQPQQQQQQQQQTSSGGMFSAASNLFGGGNQNQNQNNPNTQSNQNQNTGSATSTMGGIFGSSSGGGLFNTSPGGLFNSSPRPPQKGVPPILPIPQQQLHHQHPQQMQHHQQQQQQQPGTPGSGLNLMQKVTDMAAPGGDILSKGKELIFMKFGLGGK